MISKHDLCVSYTCNSNFALIFFYCSSIGMQACPERLGFIGHQLTCLNLSDNELQELPPEIGCLRGLQILSLQQNKLSSLPVS